MILKWKHLYKYNIKKSEEKVLADFAIYKLYLLTKKKCALKSLNDRS